MGYPCAGTCEQLDAVLIQLHTMGMPDIWADPAQVFDVLGRRHAELLAAIGDVADIFRKVRVQRHTVLARKHCGFTHQVTAHRER